MTNGGRLILTLWEQSEGRFKKYRPGLHHLAFHVASWDDLRRSRKVLDDPRITNSDGGTFGRTAGGMALVLSSGFRAAYRGSYQSLSVVPVADDADGKKRRGVHWTAKRHMAELEPAVSVGREAARRTLRKLGARPVATGEFPVVFDPDAARSILGLMAGCAMGSAHWRKASYLVGRGGDARRERFS